VNGPRMTIIDGSAGGSIVSFISGENSSSLLNGFTLTNGDVGVAMSSASPTISSNVIVDCSIGVEVNSASPPILNNYISNCLGGAVLFEGPGSPLLKGNTLVNNNGGGVE